MSPSLLDALRHTLQTGQMPEPRQRQDLDESPLAQAPPTSLTEQLQASLTVGEQRAAARRLADVSYFDRPDPKERDRVGASGRKGSLAEVLGEEEAGPAVHSAGGGASCPGAAVMAAHPSELILPFPEVPPPPSADDGGCELPTYAEAFPPFAYVAGPAGVGKTFWAKTLADHDPEGCVLAATTGIAAVNLGEGTTINALLRFFNTASLRDAYTGGFLESSLKKLRIAGLKRILLDEVSMLSGDQLTILTRAIDNVNADRTPDDPELGLLLVGDFAQLPPVKEPFAFEAAEWDRYAQHTYRLSHIRRQADRAFVEALQAVRRGDGLRALEYFRDRIQTTTLMDFDGPTLVAKNEAVDKYNQLRTDVLKTPAHVFPSTRWGKVRAEWGGPPKPSQEWGVPEVLILKEGSRVMVLANRNIAEPGEPAEYAYINGDLGTFLGDAPGGVARVRLDRTGDLVSVVPVVRENVIPLEPGRRKELKAEGHPERISQNGKWEIIGAISYIPARLAYATTVHKSQGLSLDAVQVNIRDGFFRTPGMLYVALSRARSVEGLRLVGTPEGFRARCTVSSKVVPWL